MLSGSYVDTFSDATHGVLEGASRKDSFAFRWVEVVHVDGDNLLCTGAGEEIRLPIKRRGTREYSELIVRCPTFGPRPFLVAPFKACEPGRRVQEAT